MAIGDVGGAGGEMIITCQTIPEKAFSVEIRKGDAVCLVGPYRVDNHNVGGGRVFGQALADCLENDAAIPVKVKGICTFRWDVQQMALNLSQGIVLSEMQGLVRVPDGSTQEGNGSGIVLKVSAPGEDGTVDVLL